MINESRWSCSWKNRNKAAASCKSR